MHAHLPRTAALGTCLSLLISTAAPAPVYSAPQAQAGGRPIFDCSGLQATAARLRAGLPAQDEAIRRTEAQLREARQGRREAAGDLQLALLKTATLAAEETLKTVKEAQEAISAATGSAANRKKWFDRYEAVKKSAEAIEKLTNSGKSGAEVGAAVREHQATVRKLVADLESSGISDELGVKLAEFAGPMGAVTVSLAIAARDLIYAGVSSYLSGSEVEAAERNLDDMRQARRAVESRIFEMEGIVRSPDCAPRPATPPNRSAVAPPASGGSPTVPPSTAPGTPATPAPSSPATQSPAPQAKGGGGGGLLLLALAGVGGAGYYAYAKNKTENCGSNPSGQIASSCSVGNTSACRTAEANMDAYCRCNGYSGQYGGNCVK